MSIIGHLYSTGYRLPVSTGGTSGSGSTVRALNDVSDVTLNSAANQEVLMYNSSTSQWENHAIEDVVKGVGADSIQIGNTSTNSAASAINIGLSSTASGIEAVCVAPYGSASGVASISCGSSSTASAERAIAIGGGSLSQSQYSTAVGPSTVCDATSDYSTSLGYGSNCLAAQNGVAIGGGLVQALNGIAIGNTSTQTGSNSIAIGFSADTTNSGANNIAFGPNAQVTASVGSALAVGSAATAGSTACIAIGPSSAATQGLGNIALGSSSVSNSTSGGCIAVGTSTQSTHADSITLGRLATSRATNSVQFGDNTSNSGAATMHFRTQKICDEAWNDTNIRVATIDATGNFVKSTIDPASLGSTTTFQDNAFTVQDNLDNSKQLQVQCSGIATATTRTLTVPDLSGTICLTSGAQTLTNKTLTTPVISQISNAGTITLPSSTTTLIGTDTSNNLSNKTLIDSTTYFADDVDGTKRAQFQVSGVTSGATRTLTVPDLTGTIALTTGAQTLSNKTLTLPIINQISNTGTLTLPTATDTLIGLATTDILTNKTITATSNNVAANSLKSATGVVSVAAATAPSSGQVLTATGATTATWQTPASAPTTFNDNVFVVQDESDNTKKFTIQCSGIATSTIRNAVIPNASGIMTLNSAIGTGAYCVGGQSTANGNTSVAIGNSASSSATNAIALGNTSLASGTRAISIGNSNTSSYTDGISIGSSTSNEADYGISIGNNILNTGYNSIVIGSTITNITADVLSLKVGASGTFVTNLIRTAASGNAIPAGVDYMTVTIGGVSRKIPLYT